MACDLGMTINLADFDWKGIVFCLTKSPAEITWQWWTDVHKTLEQKERVRGQIKAGVDHQRPSDLYQKILYNKSFQQNFEFKNPSSG